jgi:hypothetical protein
MGSPIEIDGRIQKGWQHQTRRSGALWGPGRSTRCSAVIGVVDLTPWSTARRFASVLVNRGLGTY